MQVVRQSGTTAKVNNGIYWVPPMAFAGTDNPVWAMARGIKRGGFEEDVKTSDGRPSRRWNNCRGGCSRYFVRYMQTTWTNYCVKTIFRKASSMIQAVSLPQHANYYL